MQMYLVNFLASNPKTLNRGEVLVCATSKDAALNTVAALFKLPGSRTKYKVMRLRPSLYVLEHKEILLDAPKPSLRNQGLRK